MSWVLHIPVGKKTSFGLKNEIPINFDQVC